MVKAKYADAYKEVLVILDTLIEEDYNKIPKEYIEYLKENCNNDYNFYYDTSKNLEQQKLLDDTKYILFGLFEKFGATQNQKEKINNFKKSYYRKVEEEKKLKYNTDIFQDNDQNSKEKTQNECVADEVAMVKYNNSLFRKIIIKIKEIFHK